MRPTATATTRPDERLARKAILVVKLADLGDVLTATPAIRALRQAYPQARLEALLSPQSASLLAGWDALDGIVTFRKTDFDRLAASVAALPRALSLAARLRGRYEAVVLLHHLTTAWGTLKFAALALASGARIRAGLDNGRGWFLTHRARDGGFGARHEVEQWLAVAARLGAPAAARGLEVPISPAARHWAAERLAALGLDGQRLALLHPGSGAYSLARRWPVERFAETGRALLDRHVDRVLVLAGPAPDEAALAQRLAAALGPAASVVADAPGPQALAALLASCDLFVGNDSGVTHLAAATGVPTVAVFGPTNDHAWGPYSARSGRAAVVSERLACRPCVYVGHQLGTPQGCPARTCLDLVEPAAVIEAAERLLDGVAA